MPGILNNEVWALSIPLGFNMEAGQSDDTILRRHDPCNTVDLKEPQENADIDDDLKSLNWLLPGRNPHDSKRQMNISDCKSESGLQSIMSKPRQLSHLTNPAPLPTRPPYTFSLLVFMAIEYSPRKMLPVSEIYAWIIHRYPYYETAPAWWKNSVRHSLSQGIYFCKVQKVLSGVVPLPRIRRNSMWTYKRHMCDQFFNLTHSISDDFPDHPINTGKFQYAPLDPSSTSNLSTSITVRKRIHPSNQIIEDEDIDSKPRRGRPAMKSMQSGNLPDASLFPYLNKHFSAMAHKSLHSGLEDREKTA